MVLPGTQRAIPAGKGPTPRAYRAPPALYREPFRIITPADLGGDQWRFLVGRAPIVRSCVRSLIMMASGIEWYIGGEKEEANEKEVDYYTGLLRSADSGAGYNVLLKRVVEDCLLLPFGGATEIGHFPDGQAAWIAHIDAATMVPTYDETFPYAQVDPWQVGRLPLRFKEEEIGRMMWQPETRSKSYGWTKTPAMDALPAIQALIRSDIFWQGFLTDTPPAGILDLMDMTEEEAREWWESWMALMAGPDPFKVPILYGGGAERKQPATFIPFQKTPAELSMMEVIKLYAQEVTACFGMSLGDLGMFGEELRLAGSIKLVDLTKRQGLGEILREFKNMIDMDILPEGLTFEWQTKDDEDEVRKAASAKSRADSIKIAVVDAGIMSPGEGREAAIIFGILPEDAVDDTFDPDEAAEEKAAQEAEKKAEALASLEAGKQQQNAPPGKNGQKPEGQEADEDMAQMKGRAYVPPRAFPTESKVVKRMALLVDRMLSPVTRRFTDKRALELIDLGMTAWNEGAGVATVRSEALVARAKEDAEAALLAKLQQEDWWKSPELMDELVAILRDAYGEGLEEAAREIDRQMVDMGNDAFDFSTTAFEATNELVVQLIKERAGMFITNINESNRRFITNAIMRGVRDGMSSPEIARSILASKARKDVVEQWRHRTMSIVNTEINWAESRAAMDQQRSLGLTKKRWVSIPGLACDLCARNDARGAIDIDEMFESVFGVTEAPPGHPNVCHCYLTFEKGELEQLSGEPGYWTGGDFPQTETRHYPLADGPDTGPQSYY